jgi:hypothetical protein
MSNWIWGLLLTVLGAWGFVSSVIELAQEGGSNLVWFWLVFGVVTLLVGLSFLRDARRGQPGSRLNG